MVQAHILLSNPHIPLAKELSLGAYGRADIVKLDSQEVWEVKHGGGPGYSSILQVARDQVIRYLGGKDIDGYPIKHAGRAGAFSGEFVINCGKTSYLINYNTPKEGVVLYYVEELKEYRTNPFRTYFPQLHEASIPNAMHSLPTANFNHWPSATVIFGAALIVASSLLIAPSINQRG